MQRARRALLAGWLVLGSGIVSAATFELEDGARLESLLTGAPIDQCDQLLDWEMSVRQASFPGGRVEIGGRWPETTLGWREFAMAYGKGDTPAEKHENLVAFFTAVFEAPLVADDWDRLGGERTPSPGLGLLHCNARDPEKVQDELKRLGLDYRLPDELMDAYWPWGIEALEVMSKARSERDFLESPEIRDWFLPETQAVMARAYRYMKEHDLDEALGRYHERQLRQLRERQVEAMLEGAPNGEFARSLQHRRVVQDHARRQTELGRRYLAQPDEVDLLIDALNAAGISYTEQYVSAETLQRLSAGDLARLAGARPEIHLILAFSSLHLSFDDNSGRSWESVRDVLPEIYLDRESYEAEWAVLKDPSRLAMLLAPEIVRGVGFLSDDDYRIGALKPLEAIVPVVHRVAKSHDKRMVVHLDASSSRPTWRLRDRQAEMIYRHRTCLDPDFEQAYELEEIRTGEEQPSENPARPDRNPYASEVQPPTSFTVPAAFASGAENADGFLDWFAEQWGPESDSTPLPRPSQLAPWVRIRIGEGHGFHPNLHGRMELAFDPVSGEVNYGMDALGDGFAEAFDVAAQGELAKAFVVLNTPARIFDEALKVSDDLPNVCLDIAARKQYVESATMAYVLNQLIRDWLSWDYSRSVDPGPRVDGSRYWTPVIGAERPGDLARQFYLIDELIELEQLRLGRLMMSPAPEEALPDPDRVLEPSRRQTMLRIIDARARAWRDWMRGAPNP